MKITKIVTTDQYDSVTYSLMWLGKLRKFWKFGVSRSSESVFGHVPQATMRLTLNSNVVNSNSTFAQRVVNELLYGKWDSVI
jgi:hypothetical protein